MASKRSTKPRCEATFRFAISSVQSFSISVTLTSSFRPSAATETCANLTAPAELRKSRDRSTTFSPSKNISSLPVSVTFATMIAERFSASAFLMNFLAFAAETTTAILSWDSLIASSVAVRPSYFLGTTSRLIDRLSASSPMATETPPAPKSLQRLIMRVTSASRNRR